MLTDARGEKIRRDGEDSILPASLVLGDERATDR